MTVDRCGIPHVSYCAMPPAQQGVPCAASDYVIILYQIRRMPPNSETRAPYHGITADGWIDFPRAKLDTASIAMGGGVRGLLRIGDTMTFYVVSSTNFPSDPLRSVAWSADTSTARITVRSDGGMTLQATAIGQVMVFTGITGAVWSACESSFTDSHRHIALSPVASSHMGT